MRGLQEQLEEQKKKVDETKKQLAERVKDRQKSKETLDKVGETKKMRQQGTRSSKAIWNTKGVKVYIRDHN